MVYNALILCIYDKLYIYICIHTHSNCFSNSPKRKILRRGGYNRNRNCTCCRCFCRQTGCLLPGIPSWSCGRSNRLLQWWFHQQTCGNMRMQPTKKVMYNDAIYNSYWSTGWWFGTWLLFFHWEFHHPNWRTHVCQRGWNHQTVLVYIYIYTNISIPKCRDIPWHTYIYIYIYIFVWVSTINLYITIYDG